MIQIAIELVQQCEMITCQAHDKQIIAFDVSPNTLIGQRLICSRCTPSKAYLSKEIENQLKDWYKEYEQLEKNHSIVRQMTKKIQEMLEYIIKLVQEQIGKLNEIEKEYQRKFSNDELIQSFKQIIQQVFSDQPIRRNELQQVGEFFSKQNYQGYQMNLFSQKQMNYCKETLQSLMEFQNVPNSIKSYIQVGALFSKFKYQYNLQYDHNCICDGCQEKILGNRFKCSTCQDFDFCSKCFQKKPQHLPNHQFIKLESPSTARILSEYQIRQNYYEHVGYSCSLCKMSPIQGIKYICTKCPQFYYCSDCYLMQTDHAKKHQFIPINDGLENDIFIQYIIDECQNNLKHKINCSVCKSDQIIGIRYRCQDCSNFNCCQKCISKKQIHFYKHKFMKLSHFHKNISCDGCGMKQIYGIRYNCKKCDNFNFCQSCQNQKEHIDGHAFTQTKSDEYAQLEKDICI